MRTFFSFILSSVFICPILLFSQEVTNSKPKDCPALTGRVVVRGDPGFDTARLVSNYYPSKGTFPQLIVYCQNREDVQRAIKWAKCQQIPIRIRSGGHNHEGFSIGDKALIIDVSEMKQLHIDKVKQMITVQPGVTGQELYTKLYQVGLTQVGGTCAEVGISGLILSGGMGPLLRREGLSCDSLVELEMVDAEGNMIQATKGNEHQDLFWACCGGGAGNFGVVTSMKIKVYPAPSVTWFNIGWDWTQPIEKVIEGWQQFFSNGDKRWFSHLDIWSKAFSIEEYKKQPVKIMGIFYGHPEQAREALRPLLNIGHPSSQVIEFMPWNKAIKEFEESTSVFITTKPEYKSTGAFLRKLMPTEAIKEIVNTLQQSRSPLLNVLLFTLGGKMAEIKPQDSAFFHRNSPYFIMYSSQWLNQQEEQRQLKELDQLRERMIPFTIGDYIGNPDRTFKDPLKEYYGDNVERLRCIKRKYDPQNIFQYEQSIPPAPNDCYKI